MAATPTQAALQNGAAAIGPGGRSPCSCPASDPIGAAATRTAGRAAGRAQRSSITVADPGGREILVAVAGLPGGTAVVRAFVSNAELTKGVTRAWLSWPGSAWSCWRWASRSPACWSAR